MEIVEGNLYYLDSNMDVTFNPVVFTPEPGTAVLFGLGLVGLGWSRRRGRAR